MSCLPREPSARSASLTRFLGSPSPRTSFCLSTFTSTFTFCMCLPLVFCCGHLRWMLISLPSLPIVCSLGTAVLPGQVLLALGGPLSAVPTAAPTGTAATPRALPEVAAGTGTERAAVPQSPLRHPTLEAAWCPPVSCPTPRCSSQNFTLWAAPPLAASPRFVNPRSIGRPAVAVCARCICRPVIAVCARCKPVVCWSRSAASSPPYVLLRS